ncbi:HIT zinc finger [Colletotrichum plurivorum]|uniref:HIT zinc finger n=1 Tax=Colletotrichum plurivorum TaxID=2175906 RepID=A0A8H6NFZ2_9PEZI|nr:HIT zinc finger [Colletotrichum plurivorum]
MATAENEASAAPASPKRAQDEVDELVEPPSKRSKTVSPEPEQEAPVEGQNDEAEVVAESTTGAAAEQEQGQKQEEPPKEQEPAAPAAASEPASAPAPTSADDTPETKAPKTKMCGICHEKEGKYKCARCALPFCSVPCNKIHRENHPPDPEPAPKPAVTKPPKETAPKPAVDPSNPFSVLDDSDQLRYLFKRYPGLRARLLEILAATEPPPEMRAAMGSSLNDMMRVKAMAAANPRKEQWTHDVGIRKGKEALRRARTAGGEDGEGVREYIELINHLITRAGEADKVEEAIRKQAAERDTELIRRLMADDRG